MKTIDINVSPCYKVHIGKGLLDNVASFVKSLGNYQKIAIITDSVVENIYLDRVYNSFSNAGYKVYTYSFKSGESSKNINVLADIYNFLARAEITRSDLVVALGGGVTGDMVGFASSSYLRGVDFINLPTTLLSMVDSSVGGKTAINVDAGKNQVGAFYQPKVVLCDTNCIDTLPSELIADGVGEIVKYAVLEDRGLFSDLLGGIKENIVDVIYKCVSIKNEYVSCDVFDKGKRQFLNLGHTLAHVIEKDSHFSISHGKAVLIGLIYIAEKFNSDSKVQEIIDKSIQVASKYNMPTTYSLCADELWKKAINDKKRLGDYITIVRPYAIGHCELERVKVTNPINYTEIVKKSKYDVIVYPSKLNGSINAIPSKSNLHRLIILSAFCGKTITINNVIYSEDILATIKAVQALGVSVEMKEKSIVISGGTLNNAPIIDCNECGSTFRFMLPICAFLGLNATFKGSKRLGERGYLDIINAVDGYVSFSNVSGLPLTISGEYNKSNIDISGKLSSQFITGILLACFIKNVPFKINIIDKLESIDYVKMTIDAIEKFGAKVIFKDNCIKYIPYSNIVINDFIEAESDFSNGAFFSVVGVDVKYNNLYSKQGDRGILDIVSEHKDKSCYDISVKNIPDLAPILAVYATTLNGESVLRDCYRLRAKECDRLCAIIEMLSSVGIKVYEENDNIHIVGGSVKGGVTLYGYNDHRMVMASCILGALAENPITITDAQAVNKSYPNFFEDFIKLGGKFDVINIR